MLTALRHAAGTWVAKFLLILLVLSFAVWGISGQITGGLGSNVVQVGSTKVSVLEYRLAYDRQIRLLSQQFGMPLTRELEHFIQCISDRSEPLTTGEEAVSVLRILTAGTVSHD